MVEISANMDKFNFLTKADPGYLTVVKVYHEWSSCGSLGAA